MRFYRGRPCESLLLPLLLLDRGATNELFNSLAASFFSAVPYQRLLLLLLNVVVGCCLRWARLRLECLISELFVWNFGDSEEFRGARNVVLSTFAAFGNSNDFGAFVKIARWRRFAKPWKFKRPERIYSYFESWNLNYVRYLVKYRSFGSIDVCSIEPDSRFYE